MPRFSDSSSFFSNGIHGPLAQVGHVIFMQLRHMEPNSSIGAIGLTWMIRLQWQQVNVSASKVPARIVSHRNLSKLTKEPSGDEIVT